MRLEKGVMRSDIVLIAGTTHPRIFGISTRIFQYTRTIHLVDLKNHIGDLECNCLKILFPLWQQAISQKLTLFNLD